MISLPLKNETKIQAVLDDVQKRSRTRILDIETIKKEIALAEEHLTYILLKKDWKDLVIKIQPEAEKFASSYRGYPESTVVTLVRKSSSWTITNIQRDYCNHTSTRLVCGLEEKKDQLAAKLAKF